MLCNINHLSANLNEQSILFLHPGLKEAFAKYGRDKINSLGVPYDYGSIMHYPWNAFSTNGRNTIQPLRRVVNQPYRVLSDLDAKQTKLMYNCEGKYY